ncbi:Rha family transcriptional regulator [Acetobacter oryzifermentans]|uniref:Rha family transcriptional regulator n=1 Tax=Acetobacter oryzifermentans TaxID=1633874 RepID=UPI0039BFCE32
MNSIITTTTRNSTLTMSSREIAKLTGKRHDNVIRDIEKMLTNVGAGLLKFEDTYINPQNGQEYRCYKLPQDLTYNLVLGYRDDLRLKVVRRWMELEDSQRPSAPSNMVEALTLALEQQKQLQAAQTEIAELSPKAAALDAISEAEGDIGVRDAGRELKVGVTKVVSYLLEHKWACREGKKLRPAHYGLSKKYCRLVPRTYPDPHTGETCIGHDFKITARGLARLAVVICGVNSEPARRLNGMKKVARKPFTKTPA